MQVSRMELQTFDQLKADYSETVGQQGQFTNVQILRVLEFTGFRAHKALRLLKKMDARYLNVSALELEHQLLTKTLFPLPGLIGYEARDFFYMRPSRFAPGTTRTSAIIANLYYVMDYFYERHRDPTRTLGFIANMRDWTMDNFSMDYCFQFMEALQGRKGPVKVDLFLIVNPPKWFDKVWNIMKPMLSTAFRKKVHMVSEDCLGMYLKPGFEEYLPAEFRAGHVNVDDLVNDFIAFRMFIEAETRDRVPDPDKESLFKMTTKERNRRLRNKKNAEGLLSPSSELLQARSS
jgi:hypothetical protein